jgi:hypothetical protein
MYMQQRVLNDLWRARPFLFRMIWLLAHHLPLSPVSKLDRRHTGSLRKKDNLLTGEEEEGGLGAESYDWQESLVLYLSFNTL